MVVSRVFSYKPVRGWLAWVDEVFGPIACKASDRREYFSAIAVAVEYNSLAFASPILASSSSSRSEDSLKGDWVMVNFPADF